MSTLAIDVTLERGAFRLAVALQVALDGITALFGPSGSGKTTLLRVIAGLEPSARGTIDIGGTVWQRGAWRERTHRRRLGYVFQEGRLFPHLSVAGNLRFAQSRARIGAGSSAIRFDDVVDSLALGPLLARRPATLSGGEVQRAAIGRALLASPRLLLMDEPLSFLDMGRKREIVSYIERLPTTFGVPVLYVTHNVDEVARLAREVVLLAGGRVRAHGTVAEILERVDLWSLTGERDAGTLLLARSVGMHGGMAALALGAQNLYVPAVAPPAGVALRVRVHARDVAIALERPRQISIRNVLDARVVSIDLGATPYAEVLLEVDGQHLRSSITRDALAELALQPGQPVFALLKSVALDGTLLG